MTLTGMYWQWIEQLRTQERIAVLLTGAALLVILTVLTAERRHRVWMLPLAAAGFGLLLVIVMAYGVYQSDVSYRMLGGLPITQPFWYDEAFTYSVSRLGWGQMMGAIAGDVHPPAWYAVEWVAIRLLGDSVLALRLPALAFGLIGLFLVYRLALALGYDERVARWSVVLLVGLPGYRYYAQEARMYSLLACGVLLAALGLVSRRNWLMAMGCVITLYTHNLGAFYVAVVAGLALWYACRGDGAQPGHVKIWGGGVTTLSWLGIVGLAWLPWLVGVLFGQVGDVSDGFWLPGMGPGGYLIRFYRVIGLMGIPDALQFHGALSTIGLLALAIWQAWRQRTPRPRPDQWSACPHAAVTLAIVPALALALVSEIWRPIYLHRALLPSLPFVAILATAALCRMGRQYRRVILAALVPVLVLGLIFQSKEGLGGAKMASDIAEHYQAGDTIYHANLASYILLSFYLPEPDYRHAVWPDAGNLSQALSLETQRAMGIPRQSVREVLEQSERILVLWIANPMTTQQEISHLNDTMQMGDVSELSAWETYDTTLVNMSLWSVVSGGGEHGHQSPGAN